MQPYNQPTASPTPKVAAVGISGIVVTMLVVIAGLFGYQVPASLTDNVPAIVAGVTAIVSVIHFVVAYLKRDTKPPQAVQLIQNPDAGKLSVPEL